MWKRSSTIHKLRDIGDSEYSEKPQLPKDISENQITFDDQVWSQSYLAVIIEMLKVFEEKQSIDSLTKIDASKGTCNEEEYLWWQVIHRNWFALFAVLMNNDDNGLHCVVGRVY